MNAIGPIPKPCATVEEWLARHAATKCPPGYALGTTAMEKHFGTQAHGGSTWAQTISKQIGADVAAAKEKRLRSQKTSGI